MTALGTVATFTYRQLDHWVRLGHLRPSNGPTPGHGYRRQWPDEELEIAQLIAELRIGGLELDAAARAARSLHEDGTCELRPGIVLRLSNPESEAA